jgi:dienelactone hydrolase
MTSAEDTKKVNRREAVGLAGAAVAVALAAKTSQVKAATNQDGPGKSSSERSNAAMPESDTGGSMLLRDIEYFSDGKRYVGYLAVVPDRIGKRPGVLIGHDGFGLGESAKMFARRIATLGYVVFVADYHGDGGLLDADAALKRIYGFMADPFPIRAIMTQALGVLVSQQWTDPHRLAAIGYCYGGGAALELGRSGADLRAIVAFHGALKTARPQDAVKIKAKVLACSGGTDAIAPPGEKEAFQKEMIDAGTVDWRLYIYGGTGHSFTDPTPRDPRRGNVAAAITRAGGVTAGGAGAVAVGGRNPGVGYNELSDRRSFSEMLALFDEVFGAV